MINTYPHQKVTGHLGSLCFGGTIVWSVGKHYTIELPCGLLITVELSGEQSGLSYRSEWVDNNKLIDPTRK